MIQKATFLKAVAALAAGLLLSSCKEEPKVIELSVSDKTVAFETAGGDKTVTVTCNDAWTAVSSADWVDVSPKSGNGNGSIKITAKPNDTFDVLSADVVVTSGDKSQTIKVNQLAKTPSLVISPTSSEIGHAGGEIELTITSNAPWDIHCPIDGPVAIWATPDKESGEGSATVKITVQPNLEREVRSITLAVTEKIGNSHQDLTITQEMAPLSRRTDSLALVAVYNASKGANWGKGNWDLTKDMSTWTGVTLTDGRVSALKLTTTVTIPESWTLPDEMENLTALTDLRINKQKLTGEFPAVIFRMTWLKVLYLQGNNFTGALPAELGQMTELTDLYVDQNASMTGSIPHEIGNLKKLMRLNVSQSGIGGEIPVELGQCESLLQFMAFKTNLSGELPDIWDMPVLQTVMLHTNPGLTGNLPNSLSKLKPIVKETTVTAPSLQLQGCNFTGNIPESFAELHEKTKQVYVEKNKMSGVIPAAVQAHPCFSNWRYDPQQEGYGLTLE